MLTRLYTYVEESGQAGVLITDEMVSAGLRAVEPYLSGEAVLIPRAAIEAALRAGLQVRLQLLKTPPKPHKPRKMAKRPKKPKPD